MFVRLMIQSILFTFFANRSRKKNASHWERFETLIATSVESERWVSGYLGNLEETFLAARVATKKLVDTKKSLFYKTRSLLSSKKKIALYETLSAIFLWFSCGYAQKNRTDVNIFILSWSETSNIAGLKIFDFLFFRVKTFFSLI